MFTALLVLILIGALLALLAAVGAVRAWLHLRRARRAFQTGVSDEVDRLAQRTGELEASLSALDERAQQLPVTISQLQESLDTLRILTGALGTSLRQAQRILAVTRLKTTGTARLSDLIGKWQRALENRPPA